jgi:hypothetical protein
MEADVCTVSGLIQDRFTSRCNCHEASQHGVTYSLPGGKGTIDVDLVLPPNGVREGINLHEHLRKNSYRRSESPTPTRYLRSVPGSDLEVALDLLTTPIADGKKIQSLEIGGVTIGSLPGLDLALRCNDTVTITGEDLAGKHRTLTVKVVRPEAFVLIKAYPLNRREKAKDAYDIAFVLQHYR